VIKIDTAMAEQSIGTTGKMSAAAAAATAKRAEFESATAAAAAAKPAEFEAATAADPGNGELWARFATFELEDDGGGGIEAARAVFERTLAANPDTKTETSVYRSWTKAERTFGDADGLRRMFERRVRRRPQGGGMFSKEGWRQYLEFEVHNGGVERVRAVGEALLAAHPMDPYAYVYYIRALAALSRHKEAFALAERGVKEISGCCRGHDERLRRFMARYIQRLETKQSTALDVINF
jgi:hypothetical protein